MSSSRAAICAVLAILTFTRISVADEPIGELGWAEGGEGMQTGSGRFRPYMVIGTWAVPEAESDDYSMDYGPDERRWLLRLGGGFVFRLLRTPVSATYALDTGLKMDIGIGYSINDEGDVGERSIFPVRGSVTFALSSPSGDGILVAPFVEVGGGIVLTDDWEMAHDEFSHVISFGGGITLTPRDAPIGISLAYEYMSIRDAFAPLVCSETPPCSCWEEEEHNGIHGLTIVFSL